MYGFRTIVSGFLGTGTNNSKDGEQERGRSDNVPVDLTKVHRTHIMGRHKANIRAMKDDDEDESPPPKINPPAIPPPRPPQRTYNAPGGVRDQIYDPYPEPPASNQPTTGSSMSNSKRKPSDIEDERRLLGSFKAPKDAVMIQLPGSEAQTPAPMRKPGAGRGFQPKNTLHDSRYQGTARPPVHTGAQRAKAATRHPNGLTLETSRGRNGRSAQDDYDFPDSDRVVKKPKLAHPQTNGQISRSAQLCSSLNSEPCSEVDGKVVKIPASSVRNEQKPNVRPNQAPRSPQWEPSGNQESRRVEEILKRPQDRGKQMARHGNGTNATRDPQKPTRNQEFLEISDDDSTVKASHKASAVQDKRGPGRPPKRRKGDVEDVVEVESRKRNDPTQHLSSLTGVNGKNPKRKPSAAETIDVDSAGRPTDIGLAASVLHALGPGKSTIQRVQEEKARHSIDDSADELDGKDRPSASPRRRSPAKSAPGDVPASDAISGDEDELQRDIPASFHKGKSVAKNAPGPPSKMRTTAKQKSSSTWKVEEFVDNYGKVHGGFGFLNLSIYIGREIKAVRLSQPGVKSHENLHVIEGQRIRGILTSSDPECRILRIRGTGTPEPWNDIKFRNHEEMVDFIEGLQVLTTLKDICLDKTL